jgi:hypothetical protein
LPVEPASYKVEFTIGILFCKEPLVQYTAEHSGFKTDADYGKTMSLVFRIGRKITAGCSAYCNKRRTGAKKEQYAHVNAAH